MRLPAGPAYKAWVFWGDGRTAEATITRVGTTGDTFTLSASHAYDRPGNFAVMIRVTASLRTFAPRSPVRSAPVASIGCAEPMLVPGAMATTSAASATNSPADAARAPLG